MDSEWGPSRQAAVSWYAVGCYYYLVGKHEKARSYFSKATSIDS